VGEEGMGAGGGERDLVEGKLGGINHNEMTLTAIYYAFGKQMKFH